MDIRSVQVVVAICGALIYLIALWQKKGWKGFTEKETLNVIGAALSSVSAITSLFLIFASFDPEFFKALDGFFIDAVSTVIGGGIGLGYLSCSSFLRLVEKLNQAP